MLPTVALSYLNIFNKMKNIKESKKDYERKFRKITFRVSPEDYVKIQEKAESLNMLTTTFVRYIAINKKLPKRKADKEMIKEINKIGKNFNQIAKKINSGIFREKTFTDELFQFRTTLETILKKLD